MSGAASPFTTKGYDPGPWTPTYTRLIVEGFETAARFWTAALRDLLSVEPLKVPDDPGYANWDLGGETVLVLFSRQALTKVTGIVSAPVSAPAQNAFMLVMRVDEVADTPGGARRHCAGRAPGAAGSGTAPAHRSPAHSRWHSGGTQSYRTAGRNARHSKNRHGNR
jgi:hypothetical protein